jgi:Conserved oligomeric complex COG6
MHGLLLLYTLFQAHDAVRYIGDMLAWVHQTAAMEKELFTALFGMSIKPITLHYLVFRLHMQPLLACGVLHTVRAQFDTVLCRSSCYCSSSTRSGCTATEITPCKLLILTVLCCFCYLLLSTVAFDYRSEHFCSNCYYY